MTKARQRERKLKKQWAGDLFPSGQHIYDAKQRRWFISEWERRRSELDHMRLAVKFGEKDEYSIEEYKAVWEELQLAGLDEEDSDLDAVEALIKKLNKADEAR
jgi:hypothetical protein